MRQSRSILGILTFTTILGAMGGGIWWRLRPPPEDEEQRTATLSEGVWRGG